MLRLAFHHDDWRYVQDHCLRLAEDPRWELRRIALTGAAEGHECDFDELFDPAEAVVGRRAQSFRGRLVRWLAFLLFLAAVLALLRAAP